MSNYLSIKEIKDFATKVFNEEVSKSNLKNITLKFDYSSKILW